MLTQCIFDWARRKPEATALIYNGTRHSYGWFAREIALARGYFHRNGWTGQGSAVLALRSLRDFWVHSLALRSLGLTTFALPLSATAEEMRLPDLRCVVAVPGSTPPGLAAASGELRVPLLAVSLDGEAPLDLDPAGERHPSGGHILRTSGTTGIFKKVLMTAPMDALFLRRKVQLLGMDQKTVLAASEFPAWTAAGYRWSASPWTVGGATIIDQGPESLRTLFHPDATHAVLVPRSLTGILSAPAGSFAPVGSLRLAVGGGPMTRRQVSDAKSRITPKLWNFLASTEAGCIGLTPQDGPEDFEWQRIAPERIVEIVDEHDRPVPSGEVGRLRIDNRGGPGEYLYDEAATQAFFRDGYFYPGDLGVMRSDGRLALRGRFSDVLNVGGHKVLPAEIETRLCDVLGLSGACIVTISNASGEEELHVVLEAETRLEQDRVAAALRKEIRGLWMARVHYIGALPRNQMGKLMRQELRDIIAARFARS